MRQKKLDSNKHSVFLLYYHLILVIKYRKKVITKSSKNREKQKIKLAKPYETLRNQREDFLHKLSKTIISENQAVVVEGLDVKGLFSNGNLSKHIAGLNLLRYGLTHLTSGRVGTTRTYDCGDCSGGGMGSIPVYESSVVEAGSSIFYKME